MNTFTPTKWSTAEDKAKFFRHYQKFVTGGFKASQFPKWFYDRLSQCFGHIAHYNQGGFYEEWFRSPEQQLEFLEYALRYPCYGDAGHTYSDVERALQAWIAEAGVVATLRGTVASGVETAERSEVARLQAKYP